MNLDSTCVNTNFIDKYLDEQDAKDKEISHILTHIVTIFKDSIVNIEDYEDLIGEIYSEIEAEVDRLAYTVDKEDMLLNIIEYFDIKNKEVVEFTTFDLVDKKLKGFIQKRGASIRHRNINGSLYSVYDKQETVKMIEAHIRKYKNENRFNNLKPQWRQFLKTIKGLSNA